MSICRRTIRRRTTRNTCKKNKWKRTNRWRNDREHYTNLVKKHGEKLTAKWVYGIVIYNGKEVKEYTWSKSNFYFVDKPCEKRNPGYPLDSISIVPEFNKYLVELSEEEKIKNNSKNSDDEVIKFIVNNIN